MQHMNPFHEIITSLEIEVTMLVNITINQLLQKPLNHMVLKSYNNLWGSLEAAIQEEVNLQ